VPWKFFHNIILSISARSTFHESKRQELLEFRDILDTAPEPVFDQVTCLATRLLPEKNMQQSA